MSGSAINLEKLDNNRQYAGRQALLDQSIRQNRGWTNKLLKLEPTMGGTRPTLKRATLNLKLPDAMTGRGMPKVTSATRIRVNEDLPVVDDDVKTIVAHGSRPIA